MTRHHFVATSLSGQPIKEQRHDAACKLLNATAGRHCKELQDTQIAMQQKAALTWLDGAPATMAKHC
jgi:hypothetical protein